MSVPNSLCPGVVAIVFMANAMVKADIHEESNKENFGHYTSPFLREMYTLEVLINESYLRRICKTYKIDCPMRLASSRISAIERILKGIKSAESMQEELGILLHALLIFKYDLKQLQTYELNTDNIEALPSVLEERNFILNGFETMLELTLEEVSLALSSYPEKIATRIKGHFPLLGIQSQGDLSYLSKIDLTYFVDLHHFIQDALFHISQNEIQTANKFEIENDEVPFNYATKF